MCVCWCVLKFRNKTLGIFLFVLYSEAIRFHLDGFYFGRFFRFRFTLHQAYNSFHMFEDIVAIAMRVCVPKMMLLLLSFFLCYLDCSFACSIFL